MEKQTQSWGDRTIQIVKSSTTIDNKHVTYVEVWNVPQDFTEDEVKLFAEICANDKLSPAEATNCIRKLRK